MVGETFTCIGKYLRKEQVVTSGWFRTSASHSIFFLEAFRGTPADLLSCWIGGGWGGGGHAETLEPMQNYTMVITSLCNMGGNLPMLLCKITCLSMYVCVCVYVLCECLCRHTAPKQCLLMDSESSHWERTKSTPSCLCGDIQPSTALLQTCFVLPRMPIWLTCCLQKDSGMRAPEKDLCNCWAIWRHKD